MINQTIIYNSFFNNKKLLKCDLKFIKFYDVKWINIKSNKLVIYLDFNIRERICYFHNLKYKKDFKNEKNYKEYMEDKDNLKSCGIKENEINVKNNENKNNESNVKCYEHLVKNIDIKYNNNYLYQYSENNDKCENNKRLEVKGNFNDLQINQDKIENMIHKLLIENKNDKNEIIYVLELISNEKNSNNFFNLFILSKLYKNIIVNETSFNDNLINYVKKNVNFIISNRHYNNLYNCFELLSIFKINEIKLYRKIIYLIIKDSTNIEENIISCYFIIKHLYDNKIYNRLVGNILIKFLMKNFFFDFLKKQKYEKSMYLLFLYYLLHCRINIPPIILDKYVQCYNDIISKNLTTKCINDSNKLISFQNILLKCNFFNSKFNILVKENIELYLKFLNPFDILTLTTNILINFTSNDNILFYNRNFTNKNNQNFFEKEKKDIKCFNKNYDNFLSMKYLTDLVIRTTDNYISNSNNLDHILRYFILSSYCHLSLFSNWWSDTSIYWKLKKKKKAKRILVSRLPYKNHFREKISYLLNIILYKYKYSKNSNEIMKEKVNAEYSVETNNKNDINNEINKINDINFLIKYRYITYLFKSYIRISIFNLDNIKNEDFISLFQNLFSDYVNLYISNYEDRSNLVVMKNDNDSKKNEKNELGEITFSDDCNKYMKLKNIDNVNNSKYFYFCLDNNISLYEISSICECFFLLKYLHEKSLNNTGENLIINNDDMFEKTLYIFFDRISIILLNKKLSHTILNDENICKELLNKYLNYGDIFFNYYLLLRVTLPLLYSKKLQERLSITRKILVHIMSLLFVTDGLSSTPFKDMNEIIVENHNFLNNFIKWENNIISINNQRRIRKKTKENKFLLDFIYANEFIRPSFIYIMCLNKITKCDDMYCDLLKNIFKIDYITTENKNNFANFINNLYNTLNISNIRCNRKKKRKSKSNAY
ncbi:conserved Plasmodium protein, unknown function [Plasmodium gallinaceum]|uniref:Uncharacterized protein n=1 Tax=Plasmodium gallinaceum TaxID=5849 RepID=A0A1J1GR41_PLAGA|nr:conserved Plasmodium protein, unknown function [Plasmodium gallinaceum]CRG93506.1 conserved Plasmodium protein, unknown function [Plasmodium gallinaceum]